MRTLLFFSNVTLGYGSPKYIYFLEKSHSLGLFKEILSYEPYEKARPYFDLKTVFQRRVIGYGIAKLLKLLGLLESYNVNRFIKRPAQKLVQNFIILRLALSSYFKPKFVVTTFESPLFGLCSKDTIFLQNFSEIWDEINGSKIDQNWISRFLMGRYYRHADYLVAPQKNRLDLASIRYANAKKYLIQNCPRRGDFSNLKLITDKKRVLYQGRISNDSLGEKILDFVDNRPHHLRV